MEAIPITEQDARVHADIWSDLSARGEPIGAHDLWIAATAIAHGLGVATRNRTRFNRIAGLRVVGERAQSPNQSGASSCRSTQTDFVCV